MKAPLLLKKYRYARNCWPISNV